ncbi:GNAT family N-acetyltransferase [Arsenicitalea aurantiaca]|uniref:GNAT family N-acetyltransferase n=1 Tax=Arsenicitalea aurantiaca TaxID=1783274 RepID=A0A433XG40_9HYPH|nr:GNAT family N-acetyltransferase [Arsenicitalea aurantiaca]RUT33071.1 GNAT family N-acetyltransferase [Arsenicitalea aurantiaca]
MMAEAAIAERTAIRAPMRVGDDLAAWADEARVPSAELFHSLDAVEPIWRGLEAGGVESPGQSLAFIRAWVAAHGIEEADQHYIVGSLGDVPVALMALHRRRVKGVMQLGWFPGPHVGCNAPLIDAARLVALSSEERRALWDAMMGAARGAALIYLRTVPVRPLSGIDPFAELGTHREADTLYRARFDSWEACNATQRTRSRRKHDRQQGERLEAMGTVGFSEVRPGAEAPGVLDTMFRQRAARFRTMGVRDPFADPAVRRFYDSTVAPGSDVDVRLHVLTLDGEIVAVRYNVAEGDALFCLISSMSDAPAIQAGSPGKQCLLRVMQTVFDEGTRVFDMGTGFTDEKRHWCNELIPVRHHYLPLNPLGRFVCALHRHWQATRGRLKANRRLVQGVRAGLARLKGAGRSE